MFLFINYIKQRGAAMRLMDVFNNIEYKLINGTFKTEITSITIDSRKVQKGSLFVCIKGFNTDGHKYIKSAIEKGASAILLSDSVKDIPREIAVVKCKDTRETLAYAAMNFYGNPSKKFNLIGVTGTNGKTSSVYFMENILKECKRKVGIIGTVQTRVGEEELNIDFATSTTPDTIELNMIFDEMAKKKVKDVVMEVSSHALELKKVDGCNFEIGIFTNLTQDHLDLHKTMENYCDAKARLFKMCQYGIINADDKYANEIIKKASCDVYTFGIEKECDFKAYNIEYLMDKVKFDVNIKGKTENFVLNVPGRFSVYNALGVIAASVKLGISVKTIRKGIENIKGVPGRIQNIKNEKGFNVFVDYAHTPDGLENIIKSIKEFTEGKVITVFGCGGDRDRKKRPIMGEIAAKLSDYTIITSDNPRSENPESIINEIEEGFKEKSVKYEKIVDRKDAIFKAIQTAQKNDSVIIAGKGHEDYEIFADRTIHFDDSEVAQEALRAL